MQKEKNGFKRTFAGIIFQQNKGSSFIGSATVMYLRDGTIAMKTIFYNKLKHTLNWMKPKYQKKLSAFGLQYLSYYTKQRSD